MQILFRLQCCTIEVNRLLYTSIYYKLLWLYIICFYVTQRRINAATKPELLVSTQKRSATWWQKVATLLYRYPLKSKTITGRCSSFAQIFPFLATIAGCRRDWYTEPRALTERLVYRTFETARH